MPQGRAPIGRPFAPLAFTTALIGALLAVLVTGGTAVASPPYSLDDRATAIASPALVYLEANYQGYLRVRATGALVVSTPVVVSRTCSGFVVGTDGYVITATHCVALSKDSLRSSAAAVVADDQVSQHKLAAGQKDAYIAHLRDTTDFTGASAGSAPTTTVYGQLFLAFAGMTGSSAVSAKVVDTQPDTALVKLDRKGLPVVKVDDASPGIGAHVIQIAFGTNDPNADPVIYSPRSRVGSVIGEYGTRTPPVYKMDGELGTTTAAGGMVVNSDGHIVGILDADAASGNKTDELVSDTSVIRDLLAKAGVKNDLGVNDQKYQAGLDAYYAGRYRDAIKDFTGVLAAQPDNALAKSFKEQAQHRLTIEGDPSDSPRWLVPLAIGLGAVVLVALIAAVIMLVRRAARRRKRGSYPPYGPNTFAPQPHPLDPFANASAPPAPTSSGGAYPFSDGGAAVEYPPMPGSPVGQPYLPAQPPYADGYPAYGDGQTWQVPMPPYPPAPPTGTPEPHQAAQYQAGEPGPEGTAWEDQVVPPAWSTFAPIQASETAAPPEATEPAAEQDSNVQAADPDTPWGPPPQRRAPES